MIFAILNKILNLVSPYSRQAQQSTFVICDINLMLSSLETPDYQKNYN